MFFGRFQGLTNQKAWPRSFSGKGTGCDLQGSTRKHSGPRGCCDSGRIVDLQMRDNGAAVDRGYRRVVYCMPRNRGCRFAERTPCSRGRISRTMPPILTNGRTRPVCGNRSNRHDRHADGPEKLRTDATEAALIRDLATSSVKRSCLTDYPSIGNARQGN